MTRTLPQPAPVAPEEKQQKSFVSAGQRVHTWTTYFGIDWIFNAIVGVSFAYWGRFTPSGKKYWSGPITAFFKNVLSPFIKNEESLTKSAGYGNMFASIIMGGMATIPPLMVLENNKIKRSITTFYDQLIYGKEAVENDPKFEASYRAIEQQPKKDFWTGLTSRFAALAPLLAIVLIPQTKKISDKFYFNHITSASDKTFTTIGITEEKMFGKLPAEQLKEHSSAERWRYIHESVAMDFGLGPWYAVLHEFFYNMFAQRKEDKKKAGSAHYENENREKIASATAHPHTSQQPKTQVHKISREEHLVNVAAVTAVQPR